MIKSATMAGKYRDFLLCDEIFLQYAMISFDSPRQDWFEALVELDDDGVQQFNMFCQVISSDLLLQIEEGMHQKSGSVVSIYTARLLVYEVSNSFTTRCSQFLPLTLRFDRQWCSVLLEFLSLQVEECFHLALDELHYKLLREQKLKNTPVAVKGSSLLDENKLVNRVFGWAVNNVYGQIKMQSKMKELKIKVLGNGDREEDVMVFLELLFISHEEAVEDRSYMEMCYSTSDQIRNRGRLKLVAPAFFDFGRCLIRQVQIFDRMQVKRKGGGSVKWAFEKLIQNVSLKQQFLEIACAEEGKQETVAMSEKTKLDLYDKFISKTFHAIVGKAVKQLHQDLCGQK